MLLLNENNRPTFSGLQEFLIEHSIVREATDIVSLAFSSVNEGNSTTNHIKSTDIVDRVFGSSLNEAALSVYVGDDKDAATNAYFDDILNRWKQSIVKHSKKYKVENWKVKDKFVATIDKLEVTFDYVGKQGKMQVTLKPTDNANEFDFTAVTNGTHQEGRKGVRSYENLVDDLEWYMMSVGDGLNEAESWATRQAAANRLKRKELAAAEKEATKARVKASVEAAKAAKTSSNKETTQDFLRDVYNIVMECISNTFPDGDPMDWIMPKLKKMGVSSSNVHSTVDKAMKACGGISERKGLSGYMADLWDDMAEDAIYDAEEAAKGGGTPHNPAYFRVASDKKIVKNQNPWK